MSSLSTISKNLDFFVIRFYHYFQQTTAGILFKQTRSENKYIMFSVFLNFIITHIVNAALLKDHLVSIRTEHIGYGVHNNHINYFIDSFMNALQEIFNDKKEKEIIALWSKELLDFMASFANSMD